MAQPRASGGPTGPRPTGPGPAGTRASGTRAGAGQAQAGQSLPAGDAQHELNQVEAGDLLGHRVLDLDARVHFEEHEAAAGDEELDRGQPGVGRRGDEGPGRLMQPGAEVILEERRGDLDQFLPPPLQAAVAVAEHGDRGAIPDDLHLDVPAPGQKFFHVDRGVAEGRLRLRGAVPDRLIQAGRVQHRPQAAAPAPGDRLHHHRGPGAEAGQERARLPGPGRAFRGPGQRDPEVGGPGPGGGLVAEQVEHLRRGPGEVEAGRGAGPRERTVLGQEAVARMQGVTPGTGGGPDDRAGVEIGRGARSRQADRGARPDHMGAGRVVVRVDRDGVDAEHGRGGHDAHRDLRPVRDEQLHWACFDWACLNWACLN